MVEFEGRQYDEVIKFDCRILNFTRYFTVLPISPKEYRDEEADKGHKLPCKVEINEDDKFTHFDITDDWHKVYRVSLTNDMKKEIKAAKKAARKEGLLS